MRDSDIRPRSECRRRTDTTHSTMMFEKVKKSDTGYANKMRRLKLAARFGAQNGHVCVFEFRISKTTKKTADHVKMNRQACESVGKSKLNQLNDDDHQFKVFDVHNCLKK